MKAFIRVAKLSGWGFCAALLAALLAALPVPSGAEDTFDFADFDRAPEAAPLAEASPVWGTLRSGLARQVGAPGRWIELGPTLELTYESFGSYGQLRAQGSAAANLAHRIEGDSQRTRSRRELDVRLREAYWSRSSASETWTVGNRITAWSAGDLITLTDRLSVTDRSRAFFADPEDVISGQNMLKFDYYPGTGQWNLVLVPYPLFDRVDDGDHPYSITPDISLDRAPTVRSPEVALRWTRDGDRGSLSWLAGWVNNRRPGIHADGGSAPEHRHRPAAFAGMVGTYARDPLLYKGELIVDLGRARQAVRNGIPAGVVRTRSVGVLLGADLNLGDVGTFIAEGTMEQISATDRLAADRRVWRGGVAWNQTACSDRLRTEAAALFLDAVDNLYLRLDASYDLSSRWILSTKIISFFIDAADQRFSFLNAYDRWDLALEYLF